MIQRAQEVDVVDLSADQREHFKAPGSAAQQIGPGIVLTYGRLIRTGQIAVFYSRSTRGPRREYAAPFALHLK